MDILEDPAKYAFQEGDFFLGVGTNGVPLGLKTERNAITFAGAGAGKGVCVIIPNLKFWPHNALVIDPKGEAAEHSWQDRENKGQAVHVLDPFEVANVPDRLRAKINPLADIDLESYTASADIRSIADGLVKRYDQRHAMWDEAAVSILAGLFAFVLTHEDEEHQTLIRAREILRSPQIHDAFPIMADDSGVGGLMQVAAGLMDDEDTGKQFLSNARRSTQWLDQPSMAACLSGSSFSMRDLKHKDISVYLVLPADMLTESSGFLSLFVRYSLRVMQRQSKHGIRDRQCLFILDEFYQLGRQEEILKAIPLMRGYGLQIWPILQDLGQLIELYGREGYETFFANSDLYQFFGNSDMTTLEHVSTRMGSVDTDELPLPPVPPVAPVHSGMRAGSGISGLAGMTNDKYMRGAGMALGGMMSGLQGMGHAAEQEEYQYEMQQYQFEQAEYQKQMSRYGRPRMPPDKVGDLVRKKDDVVANAMLAFVFGGKPLIVKPWPYFRPIPTPEESQSSANHTRGRTRGDDIRMPDFLGPSLALFYMVFPWLYAAHIFFLNSGGFGDPISQVVDDALGLNINNSEGWGEGFTIVAVVAIGLFMSIAGPYFVWAYGQVQNHKKALTVTAILVILAAIGGY